MSGELPKKLSEKLESELGSRTSARMAAEAESESWREGWISLIGRRRAMEDAVAVEEFGQYKLFAVYDGHGGSAVANACRERLHLLLHEEVDARSSGHVQWDKAMANSFRPMDGEIAEADSLHTVGSTAVVVVVGKSVVVVANYGGSSAVLCRDGAALQLSLDHKPDRADEKERVEAAGGRVINWDGCRVLGLLATSRSIGDHYLKVKVWDRTELDGVLVIASDGLWDVMSNEFVCEVVGRYFDDGKFAVGIMVAEASALLAELAMARGSKDNISVVVVDLKK